MPVLLSCIPCTFFFMGFISLWWSSSGGGGTLYMFCNAVVYSHFPAVVTALLCSWSDIWREISKLAHVLSSVYYFLHYFTSSLNLAICAKMVIPFDTIITLLIVFPPALENSFTFSRGLMRGVKGSAGS